MADVVPCGLFENKTLFTLSLVYGISFVSQQCTAVDIHVTRDFCPFFWSKRWNRHSIPHSCL